MNVLVKIELNRYKIRMAYKLRNWIFSYSWGEMINSHQTRYFWVTILGVNLWVCLCDPQSLFDYGYGWAVEREKDRQQDIRSAHNIYETEEASDE